MFMSKILPDDETAEGINWLNAKKGRSWNVVHACVKDYVQYDGHKIETLQTFLSHRGDTGKSYLVIVISNAILNILLDLSL